MNKLMQMTQQLHVIFKIFQCALFSLKATHLNVLPPPSNTKYYKTYLSMYASLSGYKTKL